MLKKYELAILGLLLACGSVDTATQTKSGVTACEAMQEIVCSKFYDCLSSQELAAAAPSVVGTSESNCVLTRAGECASAKRNEANSGCEAGKTYNASKAELCLDKYRTLACDLVKSTKYECDPCE